MRDAGRAEGTDANAALEALARLYAALLELRASHAVGEAPPPPARLRALAAELPGALRILDQMPPQMLRARAAELAELARAPGASPAWVEATLAWGALMRAALAIRRAAGKERSIERAREAYLGLDGGIAAGDLEAIVRPEEGRLVGWALGRLGALLGRSPDALEHEVFGVVRPPSPTQTPGPSDPEPARR